MAANCPHCGQVLPEALNGERWPSWEQLLLIIAEAPPRGGSRVRLLNVIQEFRRHDPFATVSAALANRGRQLRQTRNAGYGTVNYAMDLIKFWRSKLT